MGKTFFPAICFLAVFLGGSQTFPGQDGLVQLGRHQEYESRRISSYDRSGGNDDRLHIRRGETAVLADIEGPGAIHHIWVTIDAEPFYGRKIVLRAYWDGEENPSVEVPIGDFFSVGHGLNRNLRSLPIANSSEGRARNCYWYMPFQKSARLTVTNEGEQTVGAFYYYIDYRKLPSLPLNTPSFHSQYRQETPCLPGKNYLLLDAEGRGHYVGCNLSILQRAMGWWGEGDDMIYVDGERYPGLYGTGSEDYFCDAWGMREDGNLYYGCPIQEPDFKTGSKATVYRFHVPDPIPFKKSIRVTIEHGHDNDRSDYYSSVAYWYQDEPHKPFPPLPSVDRRLPFALIPEGNFSIPEWEMADRENGWNFVDKKSGAVFSAPSLLLSASSFYAPSGDRYPLLSSDGAEPGTEGRLSLDIAVEEFYDVDLFFLKDRDLGLLLIEEAQSARTDPQPVAFDGYAGQKSMGKISLNNVRLKKGRNDIVFRVTGKAESSEGMNYSLMGMSVSPASRRFIRDWNLIGPFDAPDMSYLQTVYPPEREIDPEKSYQGKEETVSWGIFRAPESGFIRLEDSIRPSERGLIYALSYVFSPEERAALMKIGSDDGVRIWINGDLVHTNPAYRGAYPDQDTLSVHLKKGWNMILIKVLQGAGGWGFYARFVDPDGRLTYALSPDNSLTDKRSLRD
ncbi:MAG: DUF2961 domain-containing protein [Acidobacteria bacterium]|nr:DUF2961 domain-containing protein [Acidobacteriota bacterium]